MKARGVGGRGRERVLVVGRPDFTARISSLLPNLEVVGGEAEAYLQAGLGGHDGRLCVCEVEGRAGLEVVRAVRKASLQTFIAVWSASACDSAPERLACTELGANMVTVCPDTLARAAVLATAPAGRGALSCVACGAGNLTEDELWAHYPLHHVNAANIACKCNVCGARTRNYAVHLRNAHGPPGRGEAPAEAQGGTPLYAFALVVCRRGDGRYLLVHEFAGQGFWLPGGAVDPGESLRAAAVREAKEEAGIDVKLTGVIRVEHEACAGYVRLRVIFAAEPAAPGQLPKSMPDYESVGASWVPYADILHIKLRGPEPKEFCGHVEGGGAVYPLELLADRGV